MRKVLILVDHSPASEQAVKWFSETSARADDEVTLFHVVGPTSEDDSGMYPKYSSFLREHGVLEEKIKVQKEIISGGIHAHAVNSAIKKPIESHSPDLTVLGHRGISTFKKFTTGIGGTSEFVVRHCSVPVLIVPYPIERASIPE
mmetsp:Transcript_8195/g.14838  ORF Transcript_8195/g.14838 Transcript_8195/m.14838 type:complete len:145 (+) Transcript_8195:259-693(+)